jgi:hypothetical protein
MTGFPSIIRYTSTGERRLDENDREVVALCILDFHGGQSCSIEVKSAWSPLTVAKCTVANWGAEDRGDPERERFLSRLVCRLWDASINAKGVLGPQIKAEIVESVLASHWARDPQEETIK